MCAAKAIQSAKVEEKLLERRIWEWEEWECERGVDMKQWSFSSWKVKDEKSVKNDAPKHLSTLMTYIH